MADLNGTWIYQSFRRPSSGSPPLVPWSPPGGRLSVTTDAARKVDGKLKLKHPSLPGGELELTISGSITPAVANQLPEGVELTGKAELTDKDGRVSESVNELRGYFVAGGSSPVIVGTIVAVKNDPGRQSDGTSGPFVLIPAATSG
jgi:hypothetical protein